MEPKIIHELDKTRTSFETSGPYRFFMNEIGNEGFVDPHFIDQYAATYAAIYGETGEGEWGESWNVSEVKASLQKDIKDPKKQSPFIISMEAGEELAGIVFGYSILIDDISETEIPFSLLSDEGLKDTISTQLRLSLENECDEPAFLYIKELGIKKSERGGFDKIYILFKAIIERAKKEQKKRIVFWTSKNKKLFPLVMAVGCSTLLDVNDSENNAYIIGNVDELAQVFSDTPQGVLDKYILKK